MAPRFLQCEWPAEADADVQDDAGSDEAERGGGDPLVRGGSCPVHAVGIGGQGAVERERDQGGEGESQGTARGGRKPGGWPGCGA